MENQTVQFTSRMLGLKQNIECIVEKVGKDEVVLSPISHPLPDIEIKRRDLNKIMEALNQEDEDEGIPPHEPHPVQDILDFLGKTIDNADIKSFERCNIGYHDRTAHVHLSEDSVIMIVAKNNDRIIITGGNRNEK